MIRRLIFIIFTLVAANMAVAQTADWRHLHQGNKSFLHKDYDQAEKHYLRAYNGNAKNARTLFNLGDVFLAKGNVEAALKKFAEAAELEANPIIKGMAHYNQGVIEQMAATQAQPQERQQHLRKAIDHYKQALRQNPRDDEARYNLALCQKQLKDDNNQGGGQNNNQQQQDQQNQQQQNQDQPQQQPQQQENKRSEQQLQQLLNLSRQAEKRAKEKVERVKVGGRSNSKNW